MNEPPVPFFQSTAGPAHLGNGPQNNTFYFSPPQAPGRSRRRHPAEDLRRLFLRFVRPEGFGRALDVLREHRTVFLDAPSGSGRIATAKMLLWEEGEGSAEIYELLWEDRDGEAPLNDGRIAEGDRLWLDLSELSEEQWRRFSGELPALRHTVLARKAHLVVVLPHPRHDLPSEHSRYVVEIKAPERRGVLLQHLRAEGLLQTEEDWELPPSQILEKQTSLGKISSFVSSLIKARNSTGGEGNLTSWWSLTERAFFHLPKAAAEQAEQLREGAQRALLLTVSMLHGAHVDGVYRASSLLLEILGSAHGDDAPLDGATFGERLREIGAEIDASSRAVRFREFTYDAAVRSYFWVNLPQLREHLPVWLEQIADSPEISPAEWRKLIERFAEQCLGDRHDDVMKKLIERWADRQGKRRDAARILLEGGLRHERHGQRFRGHLYEWATRKEIPRGLAELMIDACRDVVASRHPDAALVRLHHMARRTWREEARRALVEMAGESRRSFRQLLARLTREGAGGGRFAEADTGIFLQIAAPDIITAPDPRHRTLIGEAGVRRLLTRGWDAAFTAPQEVWEPTVRRWLQMAAQDERHRDELLTVLIEGAAQHPRVLAHLHSLPYRLGLPPCIGEFLFRQINDVQGIRLR